MIKKSLQQRYLDNNLSCLLTTTYIDGVVADHNRITATIGDLPDNPLKVVGTAKGGVINIYTKRSKK